jgi:hypothetical protein
LHGGGSILPARRNLLPAHAVQVVVAQDYLSVERLDSRTSRRRRFRTDDESH